MPWQRRCGASTRDWRKCILQSTTSVTYFLTRPRLLKNSRPPKDHHHHYTQRPWALNPSVIPLSVRSGTSVTVKAAARGFMIPVQGPPRDISDPSCNITTASPWVKLRAWVDVCLSKEPSAPGTALSLSTGPAIAQDRKISMCLRSQRLLPGQPQSSGK